MNSNNIILNSRIRRTFVLKSFAENRPTAATVTTATLPGKAGPNAATSTDGPSSFKLVC